MPAAAWRTWLTRTKNSGPLRRRLPALLRLEELESRLTPSITFLRAPTTGAAGQVINPAVQVFVVNGGAPVPQDLVTLTAAGPGTFTAESSTTAVTDNKGVATFNNLVLNVAGDYSLQAADAALAETSSPSPNLAIAPGPLSELVVSAASAQIAEGDPLSFIVSAEDQFDNPATGAVIHFSSSTTQASLPPDYTFQADDEQTFEAIFSVPGTQTITATDLRSGLSATATVDVQPVPPGDIQLTPSPSDVPINQSVAVTGSFTDPGTLDANTVEVNWDDGSPDTVLVLSAQVRTFSAAHTYTEEGDYFPLVSISNPDGGTSEEFTEIQALDGPIDDVADVDAQPGQTVTSTATDAQSDSISTTLALSPADATGGGILAAKLDNAPLPSSTNRADVLSIFDIRSTSPEVGDSAVVRFRFRVNDGSNELPVLQFLNTTTGKLQDFLPSEKNGSLVLSRQGNFIVGALILDNTTTPTLKQLTRTVFTISINVPSTAATAAVSASLASANAEATAPVSTATFRTTSQLTLTLEPTQAGQVSSSLSSFDANSSGGGGAAPADEGAAALYSFLAEQLGGGVKALWPFGDATLPVWMRQAGTPAPTTTVPSAEPAPAPPGNPPSSQEEESLRDASDLLFNDLAARLSPGPGSGASSSARTGPVVVLAGLAIALNDRRTKSERPASDINADRRPFIPI